MFFLRKYIRRCLYLIVILPFISFAQVFHLPKSVGIWSGFVRDASRRVSSYPYLSGDTFRLFCDHIFDETKTYLDIDEIKEGDTLFLVADFFSYFFSCVFPHIKKSFIIVTHNRDNSVPGKFKKYLDDDKIIAWFGLNIDFTHEKLFALPIGFANRVWPHGDISIIKKNLNQTFIKDKFLCASHISMTHNTRSEVYDYFRNTDYCTFIGKKTFEVYLRDLSSSIFVLSPRGNGFDCHRTWEALICGAIPLVPSTKINSVYDNLPVIIVDDWQSVTKEFLEQKWNEMKGKKYMIEKLFADYWFEKINSFKSK
jgi:hypothetical protein